MTSTLFFLAVVVAAPATVAQAAATTTDNFRACFCWDTEADRFCLGHEWYNAEPCTHLFWQLFAWSIPAIIGLFVLLCFPVIFYVARCLCGCCGGRHPSAGRCCPSKQPFAGYTRASVLIAKVLMTALFGGYVYYAVGVYYNNPQLHESVLDVFSDVETAVFRAQDDLRRSASSATHLADPSVMMAAPLGSKALVQSASSAVEAVGSRVTQISNTIHTARQYENRGNDGRNALAYVLPSTGLFVVLCAFLSMVFNAKRVVGIALVLFNFASIAVGVVFIAHMFAAQSVSTGCESYNETVVPLVAGAVEAQRGCNDPQLVAGLVDLADRLEAAVWTPKHSLCVDVATVCAAVTCSASTCVSASDSTFIPFHERDDADGLHPWNVKGLHALVTAPLGAVPQNSSSDSAPTMLTCYNGDSSPNCPTAGTAARNSLSRVVQFYTASFTSVEFLLGTMYGATVNCTEIRRDLYGMHNDVCNTLNRQVTTVSMCLGILYLFGFLGIFVLVNGMKRFVRLPGGLRAAAVDAFFTFDARVNHVAPDAMAKRAGYRLYAPSDEVAVPADGDYGAVNGTTAPLYPDDAETSLATLPPTVENQGRQATQAFGVSPAASGDAQEDALLVKGACSV